MGGRDITRHRRRLPWPVQLAGTLFALVLLGYGAYGLGLALDAAARAVGVR